MLGWWKGIAGLALIVCTSCTPARHVASWRVQMVPAPADQRLLHDLALTVPDDMAVPALPPRALGTAAPAFVAAADSADGERAADCLSAAVYYEARSEPLDGQRAVAQVVLNRVRDRAFPASVCRVVYQRSPRGCQFSFACDGSTAHAIEPRAWLIAQVIARAALAGSVYAPVGAATHYHTTAILPWWAPSLSRIGIVGSHVFYRWADRMAGALSFRQAYAGHETMPATPPPTILAGSPIGDGAIAEGGVTVHRGGIGTPVPPLAAAASTSAVFGVRVHRGIGDAGTPEDEEPTTPDA